MLSQLILGEGPSMRKNGRWVPGALLCFWLTFPVEIMTATVFPAIISSFYAFQKSAEGGEPRPIRCEVQLCRA